jgi:hypothetical protein
VSYTAAGIEQRDEYAAEIARLKEEIKRVRRDQQWLRESVWKALDLPGVGRLDVELIDAVGDAVEERDRLRRAAATQ